jgi:Fe-S cluster assembly protein SufD
MKQITSQIERDTLFIANIGEEDIEYTYSIGKRANLVFIALIDAASDITTQVTMRLAGEFSTATCIGIVKGKEDATIRMHTLQHHDAPNTTSNLLVKAVLTDSSTFDYGGSIKVSEGAQKTDAYQRNENLLLSSSSHAVSSPALEIKANDVRCTHGATISSIGTEELYYLMSRGISEEIAREIIADGFLKSALVLISDTEKRATIESEVFKS